MSAAPPPLEPDKSPVRVLIVDDDPALRRSLARILQSRGFDAQSVDGGEAALDFVRDHDPDVALVDYQMPRMNGLETLQRIRAARPGTTIIMMTAHAEIDVAVAAMRAGAYHFLTKPFHSNEAVALAVGKAAEHRRLSDRATRLEKRLEASERFGEIVGSSRKMLAVYRVIDGVASTTSTVLILGESGTGKELVARAIHQRSGRAAKPIVTVNCAAIPKELVESELFGHVRGAFTGAAIARAGLFESANGGTIFLDEVGDLPLSAQVKLLRVLQEGEIKRVGADETRTVDVRVIAATNVDLASKAAAGEFRQDLFYRLNVIAIDLPPLRERGDDVLVLAEHFLQKFAIRMQRAPKTLTDAAKQALLRYPWPGNVRELEHAIERAYVLSPRDEIDAGDLPFTVALDARIAETAPPSTSSALHLEELFSLPYPEAKRRAIASFDEMYVDHVMQRAGGNTSEAARLAGLDRSNFRRIMRKAQ